MNTQAALGRPEATMRGISFSCGRSVQLVGSGHAARASAQRHGPFRTLKTSSPGRLGLFTCQDTNSSVPLSPSAKEFFTSGMGRGRSGQREGRRDQAREAMPLPSPFRTQPSDQEP